ncbi:ArnT family glycosyltransferase [Radicibacter daui]|uniref:ArnT family glycosyltransferase n=1 Tax=Radicibacter daui TaxID=3064829 RepID=UPI0040468E09
MTERPFWSEPRTVRVLILALLAAHAILRLSFWPTLGVDDAEQALFAHSWQWSYRFRQPPLFTWLLMLVSQELGINIVALTALRYGLLAVCFLSTYATALRLIPDKRLAALAGFSFLGIYTFAYYSHHDLTHTTMMATAVAVSWYLMVRLAEEQSSRWYVALGFAFAAGVLGKWNFALLPISLALTALLLPRYRHLVLTWRLLLTIAISVACVLPTVTYVLSLSPPFTAITGAVLHDGRGPFTTLAVGTGELAKSLIAYPEPLLPLLLLCLGTALWRGWRAPAESGGPALGSDFVGWAMVVSIALHWLLVPTLGATEFTERWMQPAIMILPVWLLMLAGRGSPAPRAITALAVLLAVLAIAAFAARVITWNQPAGRGHARDKVPFADLSRELARIGFDGTGTILVPDLHEGGNLRINFPAARTIAAGWPPALWPTPAGNGQCLVAWPDNGDGERNEAIVSDYLQKELGGSMDAPHIRGTVSGLMKGSTTRFYRLAYRLYPQPNGDCR